MNDKNLKECRNDIGVHAGSGLYFKLEGKNIVLRRYSDNSNGAKLILTQEISEADWNKVLAATVKPIRETDEAHEPEAPTVPAGNAGNAPDGSDAPVGSPGLMELGG